MAEFEEQLAQAKKVVRYAQALKYNVVQGYTHFVEGNAQKLKDELDKLLVMIKED